MASLRRTLTPVVIECGGKDALIVAADADLRPPPTARCGRACPTPDRPASASSGCTSSTRSTTSSCAGWSSRRRELRPGSETDASYGPITMPAQLDVIAAHRRRPGRRRTGGGRRAGLACARRSSQPSVLVDVPEDSTAVTEETFGPTLTIARCATWTRPSSEPTQAGYGLGAAVFSARARHRGGGDDWPPAWSAVNSVITFA